MLHILTLARESKPTGYFPLTYNMNIARPEPCSTSNGKNPKIGSAVSPVVSVMSLLFDLDDPRDGGRYCAGVAEGRPTATPLIIYSV
ncbi:hypothetical protein EVAR_78413_1 [Eumeta japonica]|uniref:Uncharacterized protein n=1 Tax=Eumeta variegata TaxID=151549 RepID=A0A4C1T6M0_EUMVA|nr:hypothetical protein EVAR_78413_1 [Eumeta japonica]